MNDIRIAPLPERFLTRARVEGLDDQDQPVKRLIAEGGEPVRDALRRARPGEELILASYSPFAKPGPYREFGPVFILAHPDDRDAAEPTLDDSYLREQFVIRAYSHEESIADAAMVKKGDFAATVERFLARGDVAFLHARFPVYGCFAMRIER